jgi:hypothetical protein
MKKFNGTLNTLKNKISRVREIHSYNILTEEEMKERGFLFQMREETYIENCKIFYDEVVRLVKMDADDEIILSALERYNRIAHQTHIYN